MLLFWPEKKTLFKETLNLLNFSDIFVGLIIFLIFRIRKIPLNKIRPRNDDELLFISEFKRILPRCYHYFAEFEKKLYCWHSVFPYWPNAGWQCKKEYYKLTF